MTATRSARTLSYSRARNRLHEPSGLCAVSALATLKASARPQLSCGPNVASISASVAGTNVNVPTFGARQCLPSHCTSPCSTAAMAPRGHAACVAICACRSKPIDALAARCASVSPRRSRGGGAGGGGDPACAPCPSPPPPLSSRRTSVSGCACFGRSCHLHAAGPHAYGSAEVKCRPNGPEVRAAAASRLFSATLPRMRLSATHPPKVSSRRTRLEPPP